MSIPTDKNIRAVSYNGTNIPLAASEAEYDVIVSITHDYELNTWTGSLVSGTAADIFPDLKSKLDDPTYQKAVKALVLYNNYYFDVLERANIEVYPAYAYYEDSELFVDPDRITTTFSDPLTKLFRTILIEKDGNISVY